MLLTDESRAMPAGIGTVAHPVRLDLSTPL